MLWKNLLKVNSSAINSFIIIICDPKNEENHGFQVECGWKRNLSDDRVFFMDA